MEKAAHLLQGNGCNVPPCSFYSFFSKKPPLGHHWGGCKHVTWREARSVAWTVKQVKFVFKIRALNCTPLEFKKQLLTTTVTFVYLSLTHRSSTSSCTKPCWVSSGHKKMRKPSSPPTTTAPSWWEPPALPRAWSRWCNCPKNTQRTQTKKRNLTFTNEQQHFVLPLQPPTELLLMPDLSYNH